MDVAAVRSIDAATVRLLLHAQETARDTGRTLRVTGPPDPIHRIVTAYPAGGCVPSPVRCATSGSWPSPTPRRH